MSQMNPQLVAHIAQLSNIPVSSEEEAKLADGFSRTLAVVDELNSVQTEGVEPTHQVTGLEDVLREDIVDTDRMFTQEQVLLNASHTHNGYIVVPQLIGE